jgi:hypothetical protein
VFCKRKEHTHTHTHTPQKTKKKTSTTTTTTTTPKKTKQNKNSHKAATLHISNGNQERKHKLNASNDPQGGGVGGKETTTDTQQEKIGQALKLDILFIDG